MTKKIETTENIGMKVGSQNTAIARRENGVIEIQHIKTCIRYHPEVLSKTLPPTIGNDATKYGDAKYPLQLGVIDSDDGVVQLKEILQSLNIPPDARMVLASPAILMKKANQRLAQAIKESSKSKKIYGFSEGLCSAIYIIDSGSAPTLQKDCQESSGIMFIKKGTFFSLNLGSTTTEFGCFSEGRSKHLSAHPEISGDKVDHKILNRVASVIGDAMISMKQIREMKEATSLLNPKEFTVESMTRAGVIPNQICDEVVEPIREFAESVAQIFKTEVFGNIEPSLRNEAIKSPLFISGGMSNIEGLPKLITERIEALLNYKFEFVYPTKGDAHIAPAVGALMLAEAIAEEVESGKHVETT